MRNKLRRNFSLMFWLEALTEVKMINVVTAIFLVYRGLTVSQIFITTIAFSLVTILVELPSSYLADKWGRKRVIILSMVFNLGTWVLFIYAHSLLAFCLAFSLMAVSDALMSGTDEAMIFDTTKALEEKSRSLENLGKYFSAKRIFKIFTPILAAVIARDLNDSQFVILLLIDTFSGLMALILSLFLIEPNHFFKLEEAELGVFKDAVKIIKSNKKLVVAMMNRTLLFMANFAIWRISSEMFRGVGVSILLVGITTSVYQLVIFYINRNSEKLFGKLSVEIRINKLALWCFVSMFLLLLDFLWWKNWYLGLIFFCGIVIFDSIRWPMFSEIYNRASGSYNRATVLSLSNLLKSILEVPTMLLCSVLVAKSYAWLIFGCLVLALIPVMFFRIKEEI